MFVGSLTYALYVSSFFYLTNWFYYTTAVVNGIGAGLLWPASVCKIYSNLKHEGTSLALQPMGG